MTMNQKKLLFDYSLGIASDHEIRQAEKLIRSNDEARRTFDKLQAALAPLEAIRRDPCPEYLVQSTLDHITNNTFGKGGTRIWKPY